jgi:hypothetical protein
MRTAASSSIEMELRLAGKCRHWSPSSQTYAPADVLLEYLANGWSISPAVGLEEHWYGGGRHIDVYHFELTQRELAVIMLVHGNPVVRRLMHQRQLHIVLLTCDGGVLFEARTAET